MTNSCFVKLPGRKCRQCSEGIWGLSQKYLLQVKNLPPKYLLQIKSCRGRFRGSEDIGGAVRSS